MCDYPFFIPQVVLFANSSLFWFKVANEHREFRNYLLSFLYYNSCFIKAIKIYLSFLSSAQTPEDIHPQFNLNPKIV